MRPKQWAVRVAADKPVFEAAFGVEAMQVDGEWQDWSEYGMELTQTFWLAKNNGDANQSAINWLVSQLGWDGQSLQGLQDGTWGDLTLDVSVEYRPDKNGTPKLEIAFGGGAMTPIDRGELKSLDSVWGPKLRATVKKPPAKPNGATRPSAGVSGAPKTAPKAPPKAPPPAAKPVPPATDGGPLIATMDEAWAAFDARFDSEEKKRNVKYPDLDRQTRWFDVLSAGERALFPGRDLSTLTPEEWGRALREAPNEAVVPF